MFSLCSRTVLPLLLISAAAAASIIRLPNQLPDPSRNLTLPTASALLPSAGTHDTHVLTHHVPGTRITISFTIYLYRTPPLDRLRVSNAIHEARLDVFEHQRRGERNFVISPAGALKHWESGDDSIRLEIDSYGKLTWEMLGFVTRALLWYIAQYTLQFEFKVLVEGFGGLAGWGRMRPV